MVTQPAAARPAVSLNVSRTRLGRLGVRGTAILYLGLMVLVPLAAIISKGFADGLTALRSGLSENGAVEAIQLTLMTSLFAALLNAVFGTLVAYVLVRYRFPGRTLISGIVDLPFAIPTLVTGVALVALYGPNSPVGGWLADNGLQVAFTPVGIVVALTFITLPFVVRTVQPVLAELDVAEEEAALVLGANAWTTFVKVVLPALRPAITAGALLSFARAIGEFGSIVVVAGNLTGETLTAPVFIFQLINQFKPEEAAAVSTVLFGISFAIVLITYRLINVRGAKI